MSLAIVYTRAALGIEAPLPLRFISATVFRSNMVGLPETTVKRATGSAAP